MHGNIRISLKLKKKNIEFMLIYCRCGDKYAVVKNDNIGQNIHRYISMLSYITHSYLFTIYVVYYTHTKKTRTNIYKYNN